MKWNGKRVRGYYIHWTRRISPLKCRCRHVSRVIVRKTLKALQRARNLGKAESLPSRHYKQVLHLRSQAAEHASSFFPSLFRASISQTASSLRQAWREADLESGWHQPSSILAFLHRSHWFTLGDAQRRTWKMFTVSQTYLCLLRVYLFTSSWRP